MMDSTRGSDVEPSKRGVLESMLDTLSRIEATLRLQQQNIALLEKRIAELEREREVIPPEQDGGVGVCFQCANGQHSKCCGDFQPKDWCACAKCKASPFAIPDDEKAWR